MTSIIKKALGENTSTHCKTKKDVFDLMKKEEVEIVDVVFCDPLGLWHHCSFVPSELDDEAFDEGLPFDGSSIKLFRTINESDMLMVPDPTTAWIDPFQSFKCLHIQCTIKEPDSGEGGYARDPRSIAFRSVEYLKSTGIADTAYFGPEAEFFVFDNVRYEQQNNKACFEVDGSEGYWNSGKQGQDNLGHRVEPKSWYFPVSPIDTMTDLRSEMLLTMGKLGVPVEKHHHEVATCQGELGFRALPLIEAADALMTYKYVVKNVALKNNKSATFMPKPIYGDNGTGMHCHQSLWKDGKPLFYDKEGKYVAFSEVGMHYIGGILKHAAAILAFSNPSTNSYKRLVPGFEAPVNLVYSKGNRSAAVRIPMYHPHNPKAKRLEFRCPDATCNPYLAFAVMLMAGIDGIKNKIDPGSALDVDIYELSEGERKDINTTPRTLDEALDALEADHEFLLQGGVISKDFLTAYIEYKRNESRRVLTAPHPLEFVLYYHA